MTSVFVAACRSDELHFLGETCCKVSGARPGDTERLDGVG
jgi:hypothetical protein